ncbi:CDP-glucose 4,6-dehydratase [Streptomyces sp. NPDC026589]|uniref:CDP-glucose 4,6-dehydratase n=1 Tax=Streptomyces sp. NPDC026589 TaxID=3155609 RepID=UPI0033E10086
MDVLRHGGVPSRGSWTGRHVLITGSSGFIGSWLGVLLQQLGAEVSGFGLDMTEHDARRTAWLSARGIHRREGDIRDQAAVLAAFRAARPDAVVHLAAQPLVGVGLADPAGTLSVNIGGSISVLEAARVTSPAALVHVTSDKCYRNRGWAWPYREVDELGADCPYSTSKAAAELVFESYLTHAFTGPSATATASVRFGNVIGGGDFAAGRLVPDTVRALAASEPLRLRRPDAVRPWQHVLDVCHGLVLLTERLLAGRPDAHSAVYNFAPPWSENTVREVVENLAAAWGLSARLLVTEPDPAQSGADTDQLLLRLDGRLAREELGWEHRLPPAAAAASVVQWHRAVLDGAAEGETTQRQAARSLVPPATTERAASHV